MSDKKIEKVIRSAGSVSVDPQSRKVEGYALLFGVRSQYIGWYEIIDRGAVTEETINNSDVFALFNHDSAKVLARSEYGQGSLNLSVDDKGLKYSFEAPKTALGDELLEYLDRGDIHQSSFAFSIDFGDNEQVTRELRDGEVYYTIRHIPMLHDVSPVWTPAYAETYVGRRAKEIAQRMLRDDDTDDMKDDKDKDLNPEEVEETEQPTPSEVEETEVEEPAAEPSEDDDEEERAEECDPEDKEDENEAENEPQNTDNKENRNSNSTIMKEQKFSLIRAIRAIANNQELDAATRRVCELGAAEMRNSGLSMGGQIQIPVGTQYRDGVNVESVHDDLIVTDFTDILAPLRARNVAAAAGCKYLSGLVGDVQVPVMGAEQVGWAGEIADAADGSGDWSHISLTPKRLTAYIDVSKQFIAQDALGAEEMIRTDLIAALNSKLEETMLSDDAATAAKPAGLFYGLTPETIDGFQALTDAEASVEVENIVGDYKYIMSPTAKSALRNMARGNDSTRNVMEGGEVDGTPALITTHMDENTLAYGAWENVAIGQWGAIDLIVDPYTVARSGQVRIVINAYFDFKLLREGALVVGTIGD